MKEFFRGAAKIAVALVVAVVALALLGAIANYSFEAYKKRQAEPFEVTKVWTKDLSQHLGMNMMARTKLVDDSMYLFANFVGAPTFLTDPRLAARNRDGAITVSFADADGFKLHEERIPLSAFTAILNDKGEKAGLEYQSSQFFGMEKYARIAEVDVSWTIETAPIAAIAPKEKPDLPDHCAPNISRSERMKRLGAHGQIREAGKDHYEVGARSLVFFYDGSLLTCR
ncbi:hypothetical protein [Hydrogenophaga sp.]|uniref:hypothetical protein n=1 Tax=Hydrogenophaga sp. TaxID=1904254 RepID=UPI003D11D5ED